MSNSRSQKTYDLHSFGYGFHSDLIGKKMN